MQISVRLPEDLYKRLEFLALQTGRTKTYYVVEALSAQIEDLESYYLAADTLERIRKNREPTRKGSEVRKDVGLED